MSLARGLKERKRKCKTNSPEINPIMFSMSKKAMRRRERGLMGFCYSKEYNAFGKKREHSGEEQSVRKQNSKDQFISDMWKHLKLKTYLEEYQNNGQELIESLENIELLGYGCSGLVMKCDLPCEIKNEKEYFPVALKMIINVHEKESKAHFNQNQNEYDILANSNLQLNPNIVRMLGDFEAKPTQNMLNLLDNSIREQCIRKSNGQVKSAKFFILQYYNKTLESVIKENPSKEMIIQYGTQISRALLNLHECKIAHLDLKLDNIMISSLDEIVIIDFGCATKLDNSYNASNSHCTGNKPHLAPEIIIAKNSGKNLPCKGQFSWELGVLLFEMLSAGELPWDTMPPDLPLDEEELAKHMVNYSIPDEFNSLLINLLCAPEKRMHISDAWRFLESLL